MHFKNGVVFTIPACEVSISVFPKFPTIKDDRDSVTSIDGLLATLGT